MQITKQLAIFLDNRPGMLARVADALAEAKINIYAITTSDTVDHTVIPRAIFTDPQVAVVGLTDREANARGFDCECNTIPLSVVPRAGAIHDTRGVIKMVLERPSRRVLGVSMLGAQASEVIHEAAMALRFGATADDFIDLIHVYPTMAEALKLAALSFTKDVSKLSCCAS